MSIITAHQTFQQAIGRKGTVMQATMEYDNAAKAQRFVFVVNETEVPVIVPFDVDIPTALKAAAEAFTPSEA